MKLATVFFPQMIAINAGDRVDLLSIEDDDGTGDPARGWDSIERVGDDLHARRGDRCIVLVNHAYTAVPAPADENADAPAQPYVPQGAQGQADSREPSSSAASDAAVARLSRKRRRDP